MVVLSRFLAKAAPSTKGYICQNEVHLTINVARVADLDLHIKLIYGLIYFFVDVELFGTASFYTELLGLNMIKKKQFTEIFVLF